MSKSENEIEKIPTTFRREVGAHKISRRSFVTGAALGIGGLATAGLVGYGSGEATAEEPPKLVKRGVIPMIATGSITSNEQQAIPKTLREVAESRGFFIGITIGSNGGGQQLFKDMSELQAKEFNLGGVMTNAQFTQPNENQFEFTNTDFITNFGVKNGMKTFGSLIWGDDNVPWMRQGWSKNDLSKIMIDRISKLTERYKGKMNIWNVVNEYSKPGGDIFYNIIGPEYLEQAFQTARKSDPTAKLIYNDYDNHSQNNATFGSNRCVVTRDVVNRLKKLGLIDGVGLQMHLDGANPPKKQDVLDTMKSYGLPVYVTEFGVNLGKVGGTNEKRFAIQADIYQDMVEAALQSGVCNDFIVFEMVDKQSVWETLPYLPGYSPNADPTPYDDNIQKKPAYYALLKGLQVNI